MPRIHDTNDRQSAFLRAFVKSPAGPPPHEWPTPAVFRNWLDRDGFRRAFRSLVSATRVQKDFHVLIGSLHAARELQDTFSTDGASQPDVSRRILCTDLLKLDHRAAASRSRAARRRGTAPPLPNPDGEAEGNAPTREDVLRRLVHPNCRPEVAHAFITGGPHPFYDEPEYDMTVRPHRLIVRTPLPPPPTQPPAPPAPVNPPEPPRTSNSCV